ncbi:hypothetical protein S83_004266 [Arachis hypogaea]
MDSMLLQNFRCNSPDAKFSCRITQFHLCVRCRSLLLPLPRRTLPKRLEEVEESVKVLKDASKTRKVAAEKVLSALSVIEKAKIDPSGFLETLVGNESPGRTWMLIFTAEFENLKWSSELVSLERPDSWLEKVKTALIDMYAKCGSVRVAHALFEMLREERVVSWNAIITGYAMHGLAKEALELFEVMRKEARPDLITFVGVLAACSRGLLLNEGQAFYDMMMRDYGINPTVQHYTCMEVMGQEFSHEGVNSEHTSYDQYEQEEEKYEEVDVDYMDENDTSVEPMFDYHGFDEGYNIDSLEDIGMIEFWNIRDEDCGMEGHNRTTCRVRRGISQSEGRGNDTFDNDSDDHMNIEDDSLVYDENASYSSNEVL